MSPDDAYEICLLQRRIEFLEKTCPVKNEAQIDSITGYLHWIRQHFSEVNTREKLLKILADLHDKTTKKQLLPNQNCITEE